MTSPDEAGPTQTVAEPGAAPPATAVPAALSRGAAVGRYLILDPLGQGGMGVVYAGYDPELDRKVALKLLRPDRAGGEAARLRLLREAQAIARLAHPNVVAVYDAGTLGEQVFIAMELVAGVTLRRWLAERERSWREIVAVFVAAGRGLAAAHDAGLVHRDFKPDNVLIGTDGRPRVVDFGLARPAAEADVPGEPEGSGGGLLSSPLTVWGAVLGTPAYMAPEQLRGRPIDARSDQFSFCVALWEALCSARPYGGETAAELVAEVERGSVRSGGERLPGRLRQTLLRGLRAAPAERFASMGELLHALARDPSRRRRRWLQAAAALGGVGALFAGLGYLQARRGQLCSGAEGEVASLWSPARQSAIASAFTATGAATAGAVWDTARRELGSYFERWTQLHRQACEATRLRGEQSEDLLDRRMFCLDQRLQEAGALADLFAAADRQVVDRALTAVAALPRLETCSDVAALTAKLPPPGEPELRRKVEAATAELAKVRALTAAGKFAEALPESRAVNEAARAVGYGPLAAETLYQTARLEELTGDNRGAEATMFEALVQAEQAGHREVSARAASQMAWIVGFRQARTAEGERWARLSLGMAEGMQGGEALRSELLSHLSTVLANERRFAEAAEVAQRALRLAERSKGRDDPWVAVVATNLGVYYDQMGEYQKAREHLERGLAIRLAALPPGHPDFGRSYNNLGNLYNNTHRYAEAAQALEKALPILRRHFGPDHWLTAGALGNLGTAYQSLGQLDRALALHRRSLAAFSACCGGPESPAAAAAMTNLGEVLRLQGKAAESLAVYRRAQLIQERALGGDHADVAYGLVGVAQALLALGRPVEAVAPCERALALREDRALAPSLLAGTRFVLARALWESGRDRGRAVRLARLAAEAYAADAGAVDAGAADAGAAEELREVEAWLAARPPAGAR